MQNSRIGLLIGTALVVLLAIIAGELALDASLWGPPPAPRPIEPRGQLSDVERTTTQIFERVSPSVVQVVALGASNPFMEDETRAATGTGFIWDDQGHVVTNNHVVQNAAQADVVGLAPNYDLAF